MMYKFIIFCGVIVFFFFLIVLQWFGHVFSNKGRFGHKRKLPGLFYFLSWCLLNMQLNQQSLLVSTLFIKVMFFCCLSGFLS